MLNVIAGSLSEGTIPTTNSYESIATYTASGGETSFTFSSIPSTYKHLQIRYISRGSSTDNVFYARYNSDSTSGNYANHLLYGDGSSAAAAASLTEPGTTYMAVSNSSRLASTYAAGVIDILDYADTNKYKTQRALTGREDNSAGIVIFASGLWKNTAAITSVTLIPVSGTWSQYSSFALYGIKG